MTGELKDSDPLINKIHSYISSGKDGEAIKLISLVLESCNDEIFLANCIKWMQHCCKNSGGNNELLIEKLVLFVRLIKLSKNFPELVRPISNTIAPRFSDLLLKKWKNSRKGWEAMAELMSAYGGSLMHCKELLETFLTTNLESKHCPVYLARCWALFPCVGGGGTSGTVFKANWSAQINVLIQTAHHLLSVLFKDVAEFEAYTSVSDPPYKISSSQSVQDLAGIFSNMCSATHYMLLGYFPVAKNIPVGKIIALFNRVISVSASVNLDNWRIGREISLKETLPTVLIAALNLLTALIVSLGRALLPIANYISKTLMQAVQLSEKWPQIRLNVYMSLSNWIAVSNGACCLQAWPIQILLSLLKDFEPVQMSVKLKGKGTTDKGTNGRIQFLSTDAGELVRYASIETFSLLVTKVGVKLAPLLHKAIQTRVIREICQMSKARKMSGKCRIAFLTLLRQLCMDPSPLWPPPTQFALHAFRIGVLDPCPIVASSCSVSISALQRIIYPEFSVAAFPVDRREVERDLKREMANMNGNLSEDTQETKRRKTKTISRTSSPWQAQGAISDGKVTMMENNEEEEIVDICDSPPPTNSDHDEPLLIDCRLTIPERENLFSTTYSPELKRQKLADDLVESHVEHSSQQISDVIEPPCKIQANDGPRSNTHVFLDASEDPSVQLSETICGESNGTTAAQCSEITTNENSMASSENLKKGSIDKRLEIAKKEGKRGKGRSDGLEEVDITLPMSLRSGTYVLSRRSPRNLDDSGSVGSRSLPSSPGSGIADPEAIMELFDDTLQPDLQ